MNTIILSLLLPALTPLPATAEPACSKTDACSESAAPASPFLQAARSSFAPEKAPPKKVAPKSAPVVVKAAAVKSEPAPVLSTTQTAPEPPAPSEEGFSRPFWFFFSGLGLVGLYLYLRDKPGGKGRKR